MITPLTVTNNTSINKCTNILCKSTITRTMVRHVLIYYKLAVITRTYGNTCTNTPYTHTRSEA